MIPKTIHYCWFGGNPLPKLAKRCIKSWRKYCPDYQIIEWNESNFDISSAPLYVRQAYEAKKWAFVTDYVRLQVVYEHGGIYLDTDVEIIKPIDDLLKYDAYFGFEDNKYIDTGLGFGAIKGSKILRAVMDDYMYISFIKENGSYDILACPARNTPIFIKFGLKDNGETQFIDNYAFFNKEYLCPMPWQDRNLNVTDKTYSIHWFSASWHTKEWHKARQKKLRRKVIRSAIKKMIGEKLYYKLKDMIKK